MTAEAIRYTIAPWLTVRDAQAAIAFYKEAFAAVEVYRMEDPGGGLVVRLAVHGAEFWVSGEASKEQDPWPETVGGGTVRMILTVADPDAVFKIALAAGATEIFPVGEDYGWRLGRVADPFGLHWEIGKPLTA